MSDLSTVNQWSLGIVSGELDATIRLTEKSWADFIASPDDRTPLKSVANNLAQITGALQLVNIRGLDLLASELADFTRRVQESDKDLGGPQGAAVSAGISGMERYLTWLKNNGRGQPELLIPLINDLRAFNGGQRLHEQALSEFSFQGQFAPPESDSASELDLEKFAATGRRIRQMYQLGLIRIIRDPGPVAHLVVMQRACERMYGMLRTTPAAERWLMTAAVLTGLANKQLQLTSSRTRWLSTVDRAMRALTREPEKQLEEKLSDEDRTELLYLIALMPNSNPLADLVGKQFSWTDVRDDHAQASERDFIYGVGQLLGEQQLEVLQKTLNALREELSAVSEDEAPDVLQMKALSSHLGSILLELGQVGGENLRDLLQSRQLELQQWVEKEIEVDVNSLTPLADALVMLDSVLQDSQVAQVVTDSPTAENAPERAMQSARLGVIAEALAELNLAKRAITSFVEAGYDSAELDNIVSALAKVRGSLQIIQASRAVNVLQRCEQFVQGKSVEDLDKESTLLETLADALVSLEYYLQLSETGQNIDDSVLDLADESLASVGFAA